MADYDRGYRTGLREYGSGDRKLEIVSGKVFSANRTFTYSAPRLPLPPSDEHPPPLPPLRRPSSASSIAGAWCFSDPEMNRRRRVAGYKAYAVEGKVKASIRKGFHWIKSKCSELVHGW